jgi:ubiquitin carboxyl-terminal hydrolase 14
MVHIKLKWNKLSYDINVDSLHNAALLKEAIYNLTGVPKDRQKLMAKGAWVGTLKDDADLTGVKFTEGQQVMLMGTADVVVQPKESVVFLEDMSVQEKAAKGAIYPSGLVNVGNTCYLNSTVECLRHMPELREAMSRVAVPGLTTALKLTYDQLDASGTSLPPFVFVQRLRTQFPLFGEANQHGFLQQDAEEFYNTIITTIRSDLDQSHQNFNSILGLNVEEELTCQESDQEAPVIRVEPVNKIVCNIQGGAGSTVTVDHLHEGVKLGLEGTVEKFSAILNRNALWRKKQRICTLPRYICFQFMRFFWKATPESRDHRGVKCKVLRAVNFPEVGLEVQYVGSYCRDLLLTILIVSMIDLII